MWLAISLTWMQILSVPLSTNCWLVHLTTLGHTCSRGKHIQTTTTKGKVSICYFCESTKMNHKLLSWHKCSSIIIIEMIISIGFSPNQKVLVAALLHSLYISQIIHPFLCTWFAFPLHLCWRALYSYVKIQVTSHFLGKAFLVAPRHSDQTCTSVTSMVCRCSYHPYISGWNILYFSLNSRNNDLYCSHKLLKY